MIKPGAISRDTEDSHSCNECNRVRLVPYENQVSGHHRVMLLNESTICKPLMEKEHAFYTSAPLELQRFTPTFKGIARAVAETEENGATHMFASHITDSLGEVELNQTLKGFHFEEQRAVDGVSKIREKCKWKCSSVQADGVANESVYEANPWVLKVQQMSFEQNMYKSMDSKLILLENVGHKLQRPCILDLKMGIRQHGDDATVRKIKDHQDRCAQSTSKSLGVRLCGMQVYDPATHCYSYTDKYAGRNLDAEGFKSSLLAFLNNGMRTDVIEPLTNLLEELRRSIEKLDSCRFFCSSLLLMYDGEVTGKLDIDDAVEVRMIDFANITLNDGINQHDGPDAGYMFGLQNLICIFQNIANKTETVKKTSQRIS